MQRLKTIMLEIIHQRPGHKIHTDIPDDIIRNDGVGADLLVGNCRVLLPAAA